MPEPEKLFINLIFKGQFVEAIDFLKVNKQGLKLNSQFSIPGKNLRGITPLLAACSLGGFNLVAAILESDPSCLEKNDLSGKTALHHAAAGSFGEIESREDIIVLLVNLKRELLTEKDNFGNTPLHLAALEGKPEIARFLLNFDQNLAFLQNNEKKIPINVAKEESPVNKQMLLSLSEKGPAIRLTDDAQNLDKTKRIPSLVFLCLQKIVNDPSLRKETKAVLPSTLDDDVELYTSSLTKYLSKMTANNSLKRELDSDAKETPSSSSHGMK